MYEPTLREVIAIHRRHREVAIFVSQPANPALVVHRDGAVFGPTREVGSWAVALDEINAATQKVCRQNADNCRFADLANLVTFEPADFYDLVHNTPRGSQKIGTFLAGELAALRQSTNH